MYLWIPLLNGQDDWQATEQLMAEQQIVITPGSGFGPGGAGYVRISMVALPRVLEEACERIAGVLNPAATTA
jgi:aspartate/methionine/tyrosine aminotransferase